MEWPWNGWSVRADELYPFRFRGGVFVLYITDFAAGWERTGPSGGGDPLLWGESTDAGSGTSGHEPPGTYGKVFPLWLSGQSGSAGRALQ